MEREDRQPRTRRSELIVFLQSHATQFDDPLFRTLSTGGALELRVCYTRPDGDRPIFDGELGRSVGWNLEAEKGYSYEILPRKWFDRFISIRALLRAAPDLLVISGYDSVLAVGCAVLAKLMGVSTGLRSDNISLYRKQGPLRRFTKRAILQVLYRLLYDVGFPVGTLARDFMKNHGFPEGRLFVLPYSIDGAWFTREVARCQDDRDQLRSRLGLRKGDLAVLGVAKFVEREDPLTILKAYEIVAQKRSNVALVLAGEGRLRPQIEQFIRAHRIEGVSMPGYVEYSRLPALYAACDVFVHAARRESWGVSVNEAMASGLAVIVADTVGSAWDLITNGSTGFTFCAGNCEELARRLIQLVDKPEVRIRMGAQGQERVLKSWSLDAAQAAIMSALGHLEKGVAPPGRGSPVTGV